jgi:hypothetical protein
MQIGRVDGEKVNLITLRLASPFQGGVSFRASRRFALFTERWRGLFCEEGVN